MALTPAAGMASVDGLVAVTVYSTSTPVWVLVSGVVMVAAIDTETEGSTMLIVTPPVVCAVWATPVSSV